MDGAGVGAIVVAGGIVEVGCDSCVGVIDGVGPAQPVASRSNAQVSAAARAKCPPM
jgi:hypothetical protein